MLAFHIFSSKELFSPSFVLPATHLQQPRRREKNHGLVQPPDNQHVWLRCILQRRIPRDGGGGKETLGNHFCNSQESRGFVGSYILQFSSAADCCTQVRKTGGNKSPREDGNFVGKREGRIFSSSSTFSKSRISVLFFLPPNQPRPDPSPLFLSEEFGRRGLEEEGGNI